MQLVSCHMLANLACRCRRSHFFCLVPPLLLWDPPYEHFHLDKRPHLSKDGLFGKGTYLAEDAAKIDQYLKQDLGRGNKLDHELQKLYEVGVKHATHVYYALGASRGLQGPPGPPQAGASKRAGLRLQAVCPEGSRALLHSGPSAYTNEKVLLLTKMDLTEFRSKP